jgi:hypothetical protein
MTKQQFQQRYHTFRTDDPAAAWAERDKVNFGDPLDGDYAVVVNFGHLGYGLMLNSAAVFMFALDPHLAEVNGYKPLRVGRGYSSHDTGTNV